MIIRDTSVQNPEVPLGTVPLLRYRHAGPHVRLLRILRTSHKNCSACCPNFPIRHDFAILARHVLPPQTNSLRAAYLWVKTRSRPGLRGFISVDQR